MKKIYGIISFFLLWYLISYLTNLVVPYPHVVINNFVTKFDILLPHILTSSKRLFIGLIISVILGVHIGLLLGLNKTSDSLLSPLIYVLYPIPKAALTPVFIILFGLGDLPRILLIIFIVIFPIIINTKDAIKLIPRELFYAAASLNLTKVQFYKDFIIPAILPNLFTTLRVAVGTSIAVLYLGESFAAMQGLGYFISVNLSINNLMVYTAIFALSLIGAILFILISFLEKKVCQWV